MNPEYYPDVRRARREYRCGAIRESGCIRKILSGDVYFCLTEKQDQRFRTLRYCLDCAQQLYPDLLKTCSNEVKSLTKQRAIKMPFKRAVFAERRSHYLRRRSSEPENYLWSYLKNRQLGAVFFRQKVLHGFVVDFWSPELKLAIEIDGKHHLVQKDKDNRRDQVLQEHGITVVRYPAMAVYEAVNMILDTIREFQKKR